MDGDWMVRLAQALADAKSRRDVPAAMRLFAPSMILEVPAFGVTARGLAQNEKALARFFTAFPDYAITLEGHACDGRTLACWGTARMTMTGDGFGVVPSGRRAELPVFIQFSFADGLIAGERFWFDLSELCAQSGVSADAVRQKLFRPRPDAPGSRIKALGEITTSHLLDMVVDLNPQLDIGSGPFGRRVLFGSAGGSFEGPRLRGDVLPGGGDWTLLRPGGAMTLDVRLTLRTDDGALLHMTYGGRWLIPPELRGEIADPARRHQVDPAKYYFRTNPVFETGAKEYAWLNDIVCVGSGYLVPGGVGYKVCQVI